MNYETIIIKKYENRRLYDTSRSQYVNLDEVAQLVQDGRNVQVLDAATGEDLTRLILTQIIVEHAKAHDSVFPLDVLRQMVAASGRASQENALKYLQAISDMYQSAFRTISPSLPRFDLSSMPWVPRSASMDAPPADPSTVTVPPPEPVRSAKDEASEVADLKRRLEELESLASKSRARKPSRQRKARSRRKS
jgi:polyhydroxyalkanoate synthesis repressor PhaR